MKKVFVETAVLREVLEAVASSLPEDGGTLEVQANPTLIELIALIQDNELLRSTLLLLGESHGSHPQKPDAVASGGAALDPAAF